MINLEKIKWEKIGKVPATPPLPTPRTNYKPYFSDK